MRLLHILMSAAVGTFALPSCDNIFSGGKPPPPVGASPFKGTVKVEFMNPEKPNDYFRDMRLLEPFGFVDSAGVEWDVPAGSVTNGASVPPGTWNVVGGPYDGMYREAAVLHDYYVEIGLAGKSTRTAKDTHRMFYEAMRARGVSEDLSKTMYLAVQLFGPTWEVAVTPAMVKGQVFAGATPPASPPAPAPAPPAPAATAAPKEPAAAPGAPQPPRTRSLDNGEVRTLEDLKAWVEREKPSLEEIDRKVNQLRAQEGKAPVH